MRMDANLNICPPLAKISGKAVQELTHYSRLDFFTDNPEDSGGDNNHDS